MDNRVNPKSQEVMEKLEKIQRATKPQELRALIDELEQHQFFTSTDVALAEEQTLVHEKIGALLGSGIMNDKILNSRLKTLHQILGESIEAKKTTSESVTNPPSEPETPAQVATPRHTPEPTPVPTTSPSTNATAPNVPARSQATPDSAPVTVPEAVEKNETSELIEKTLKDYWPEKEIPGLKLKLTTSIRGYLENFPKSKEAQKDTLGKLQIFLDQKLLEKSAVFGISKEDQTELENKIRSSGKENVINEFKHEIDLKKRAIAKADEDIVEARGKRGTESRGGKDQTEYKIQINKEIDELRKGKKEKLEELEALEDKAKSIDAVADNLEKSAKRPSAKKLLTYTHYFFIKATEQYKLFKEGKGETAPNDTLKRQREFYSKALVQTNEELGKLKLENLEGPGALKYLSRRSLKLKHLLTFMAEKEMAERFPEKTERFPKDNREQGKKWILQLKDIDPESAKGKVKLDKWIAELGTLLPPEGKEEAVQKFLAATIATMEGSMNGQKWREGVNNSDLKKIVGLTSGIRHAYERRLEREGGDIKALMTKIDTFDKLVAETQLEARGELPKELREYFKANDWLWKAAGFLGANLKEGAKAMAIGAGKGIASGAKWVFRNGWEKIKAHPKGIAAVTLGLVTGTLVPGLIAFGLYKGYQKYKGQ